MGQPMVFLLDNYDSFTYNLWQYLAELGEPPQVAKNDETSAEAILAQEPRALVLSPGPGRPEQAGILNELIAKAAGRVPMLGVCLGHQAISQVFGGSIGYAPVLMHGKTSMIHHDGSSLFRDIETPFEATRYHSLVIEPESLPDGLAATAWTEDGIVMGMQHRELPIYGVQFHPESIMTHSGKKILRNFLESLT